MKKLTVLFLAVFSLLAGCSKNNGDAPVAANTEKKFSIDLNENQIRFVLAVVFENSVAALRGQGTDAARSRALHNFNIIQAVDARILSSEYNENEVAADQKFKKKGTYIYVKGTVSKISKDFKGEPYVSLKGESMFNDVQAKFGNADLDVLMKLKPGQKVDFVCEVGNKIVTFVILRECNTIETHTEDMRASIGLSSLSVMEGKVKASQEGAEGLAAMYLLSKQLSPNSPCFTNINKACENEIAALTKLPQSPESQAAFRNLVAKWSKDTN